MILAKERQRDPSVAHSSHTVIFPSPEPRSTPPLAVAIPELDHSAQHHPFSVPFSPRTVQNFALASDLTSPAPPAFVDVPSTFHASRTVHSDVYCDSEHAQTTHSLSESSTRVALAPGGQEHFISSSIRSAAHSTGYSTFLGRAAIVPSYTSISASPFLSDTPPSIIQPFTSSSSTTLTPEARKYIAPHRESPRTFQTCIETTSVTHTHSDSSLAIAPRLVDQEHVTPSLIRSAAPPRVLSLPLAHAASIATLTLNLAPPCRSYALPSITKPHTPLEPPRVP